MKLSALGLTVLASLALVHCQPSVNATEKTLVRCRRPLCEVYCPLGTQKDEDGCETCHCTAPPSPEIPAMPCAEPMCANDCREFGGYKKNERGCMTCECMERITCEDLECSVGQFCRPDLSHCQPGMEEVECLPKPICVDIDHRPGHDRPRPDCPMYKCEAKLCEHGRKRDENDCPTCECASDPCETHECHQGQICVLDTAPGCDGIACPVRARCTFKSLCHHHQHYHRMMKTGDRRPERMRPRMDDDDMMGGMMGGPMMGSPFMSPMGYMPRCEEDGDFHPQQCSLESARPECWCVNDMGQEMQDTRRVAMVGDQPTPKCERNHTESLELKFQVWHEFDDIMPHLDSLKNTVKEHLSHWLTVEQRFIMVVKIEPDGSLQRVQVHVLVMQDGKTDLASAAHGMLDQMRRKHCNIHFHGQTMRSDPDTLQMNPRYRQPEEISEPVLPREYGEEPEEEGVWGFCKAHQTAVIVGCVGGTIILICLTVVIISAARKKRAAHQFRHKRFDNYQKNLTLAGDTMKHPDDLEKEPPVAVISVVDTDPDHNNSSVA